MLALPGSNGTTIVLIHTSATVDEDSMGQQIWTTISNDGGFTWTPSHEIIPSALLPNQTSVSASVTFLSFPLEGASTSIVKSGRMCSCDAGREFRVLVQSVGDPTRVGLRSHHPIAGDADHLRGGGQ